MAFKIRQLSRYHSVSYDDNGTSKKCNFYNYVTTDPDAAAQTAGYFNDARAILNVGDSITAICDASGTPERVTLLVATVPASGDVTVAVNAGTDDTA
ncbi:hypothetical protein [uncultured Nitratireductor sp.]|uniref:hypothetical protein n=1 Tax=uncultured Nitratireductor sp. TaxID=520953 RepID=UPI0025F0F3A3|nr:hypothetical protein [uncultured Nitratireductor sp.]